MPSLKAIRNRIGSVKSTRKITRAMKMVAAARLRKAQQRITELRPYAVKTMNVLSAVASRAGEGEEIHPLLARREPKNIMLVVLTSDRGLAGPFNASIQKATHKFWREREAEGRSVSFAVIGRKGREFLRRRKANIVREFTGVFEKLTLERAEEIGRYIVGEYQQHSLDAVYLVYSEFKGSVKIEPLLPIEPKEIPAGQTTADFIYEPNKTGLLDRLLPMYVEIEIYRALLESVASEHIARMMAMDSATTNASELIKQLTLEFNRARQAAITKELMEIIGGAEALK